MRLSPLIAILVAIAFVYAFFAVGPVTGAAAGVAVWRWTAFGAYLAAAAVVLAAALASVLRGGPGAARRVALALLVGVAALPLASMLGGSLPAAIAGAWAVVWVAAMLERGPRSAAVGILAAATGYVVAAITLADAFLPRQLAAETLFGYDPSSGMRLYGLGNEMAALMVGGLVAGWALLAGRDAASRTLAWRALAASGAVALAVGVAPVLGANIGALAWGGVAVVATAWESAGRRVTWRGSAAVLGAFVVVACTFAFFDSISATPTHIGVAWLELVSGDWGALAGRVAGRAANSWRILTYSPLASTAIAAMVALLANARLAPGPFAAPLLAERPALRAMLTGVLLATPVALLVEDSGIAVPAIMLLLPSCAVLAALLEAPSPAPVPAEEAAE